MLLLRPSSLFISIAIDFDESHVPCHFVFDGWDDVDVSDFGPRGTFLSFALGDLPVFHVLLLCNSTYIEQRPMTTKTCISTLPADCFVNDCRESCIKNSSKGI